MLCTGDAPGTERRKWLRKGYYHFHPTYNSQGGAYYTITLHYDEKGISCICKDRESGREILYPSLDLLDGEEVELKLIEDSRTND